MHNGHVRLVGEGNLTDLNLAGVWALFLGAAAFGHGFLGKQLCRGASRQLRLIDMLHQTD